MQYIIDQGLIPVQSGDEIGEHMFLEIISIEQYKEKYKDLLHAHFLTRSMEHVKYCKVDVFKGCVIGTLHIPVKKDLEHKACGYGFYMDEKKLLLVGDEQELHNILMKTGEHTIVNLKDPAHVFFEFLQCIVYEEVDFINDYEEDMESKEGSMAPDIDVIPKDFEQYVMRTRRELMILHRYYKQMAELGEALGECPAETFSASARELFLFFAGRMNRLYADVQELKEYALQIRDMYQARIDVRHNNVIQFLTIVTTIFMPLTLITGWYGMNFAKMPELQWSFGYALVICISAVIIILELYIFRKNKWL